MTPNDFADDDEPSPSHEESPEDVSRRRLIRLLVGLGIGIPLAIEASTFFGLLSGERGDERADIGDELLDETPQAEMLVDSSVYEGPPRVYELVIEVQNDEETSYELTAGPLFTVAGEKITGTTSIAIPAGEAGELRKQWGIPQDAIPGEVDLKAVWGDNELSERVALSRPAVYEN